VIGCVVNGPGEAREADIGLAGGSPNLLYLGGKPISKVTEEEIVDEIERQVRAKIAAMKDEIKS
jgi:(E)-4-hydroxy-3-methylbut-2-enyl-diphosphate synthase